MSQITIEEILNKSQGGLLIYKMAIAYLDLTQSTFSNLKNPFYDDKNPSMSIYKKDEKWFFRDFGSPEYNGDALKFASYYYDLDIKDDFRQILENLNIDLDNLNFKPIQKHFERREKVPTNTKQDYELIQTRSYDDFTNAEIEYLNQYGINKDAVENLKVIAVDQYFSGGENGKYVLRPKDFIWFGYVGKQHVKIYCPGPKKAFWYIGTRQTDYYFGSPLDHYGVGETIYITGGEKDVLSLVSRGYLAICLNSETADIPKKLMKELYECKLNPILLYDNDETGIESAQKLSKKYNIEILKLPEELIDCGGKDISDFFRLGFTESQLESIQPTLHIDYAINEVAEQPKSVIRTAQQRLNDAKNQPEILMLLDVFMHSGELAVLFGDTGIGKSVLGVSIADALSRGVNLLGLENQCLPQKVIYYDFELSDKQFEKRYSNNEGTSHTFSSNLYTDCIDFSEFVLTDRKVKFEHLLIERLKKHILEVGANIIIIDNITFLSTQTSQDAQVAMEIMKLLKQLKEEMQVSILVLAHTPKRPPSEGITINHLAGSKHISNFADSVFAIGISKNDKGYRYMKQVKPSRSGELKFDDGNVLKCELLKENDFLTFSFIEYCDEKSMLAQSDDEYEEEAKNEALELKDKGMTIRDIATKLGFSKSKVGRWLQEAAV